MIYKKKPQSAKKAKTKTKKTSFVYASNDFTQSFYCVKLYGDIGTKCTVTACETYINTKQPNCTKRCSPYKKGSMKKVVKSKVAAQKWLWWSDNGKFFNNNNSGEFVLSHHFWAATFYFTTFFMLPFFFYSVAVFV